ncbi:MAG: hypothetical protein IKX91_02525, partial [Firmicutes bacterium]|nr:hypothetical protein [Bacillota bacterium]
MTEIVSEATAEAEESVISTGISPPAEAEKTQRQEKQRKNASKADAKRKKERLRISRTFLPRKDGSIQSKKEILR